MGMNWAGCPRAESNSFAPGSLIAAAGRFITLFHSEHRAGPPDHRLRRVRREIEATGTYGHTVAELAFGARVAWRNSSRCVGQSAGKPVNWSGWPDSNRRPPAPKAGALTKLRHIP
jgi:Nitric oxide synthase, oxygenase domain